MSKFNPFADDVLHAAFENKEGVVMTVSTAELVKIDDYPAYVYDLAKSWKHNSKRRYQYYK